MGQLFAGRYRVTRFLAAGGMGAVYVAEQISTELPVALKVLFPHVLANADAAQKFEVEAKIAARVRSENIVQVLDAGVDEETGMPFLAMELLQGKQLEDVVLESGRLSSELVVEYLSQTAAGLDKAHFYRTRDGAAQAIVHRDLKPENLFLTHRENGHPVVKILDFGIAKVLSDTANVSQEIKGTPLYMAFEQASGLPITAQTDVWALGLIAFFLLTGKPYWRAASNPSAGLPALFGEVLAEPLIAASARSQELGIAPTWPPSFDAWFSRCVHRDPAQRYASAGAAAQALAAALGVSRSPSLARVSVGSVRNIAEISSAATLAVGANTSQVLTFSKTGPPKRRSAMPFAWVGGLLLVGSFGFFGYRSLASTADSATGSSLVPAERGPAGASSAETPEATHPVDPIDEEATAAPPHDSAQRSAPSASLAPTTSAAPAPTTVVASAKPPAVARRVANPSPAASLPSKVAAPKKPSGELWDER
ncbi:MAG: hypothetical protein RJA70_1481 [Pseudomonadota bacterium]